MDEQEIPKGADDSTLAILKTRLAIFKRQKNVAKSAGRKKIARIKLVSIKQLREAVKKAKAGTAVDLDALPNPIRNTFSVAQGTEREPEIIQPKTEEHLKKKPPVERKSNYCILCDSLVKKFSEHVESKHPESDVGQSLKNITVSDGRTRRLLKMKITDRIRKKWNTIYNHKLLNTTKNFQNLCDISKQISVKKRTKLESVPNVQCRHCDGLYRRDKLSVHLKICKDYNKKLMHPESTKKALKQHSKNILPEITSVSESFKQEILNNRKLCPILSVAVNDPLIMRFGSDFHKSRRAESDKDYIMRVIRDITKLFVIMRDQNPSLKLFHNILSPVHFEALCDAVLEMAKYDPVTGSVQIPSIAYRISQPLKDIATLAKSEVYLSVYAKDGKHDRTSITMIDDFLDLMNKRWKNNVGRICTKTGKKRRVMRHDKMALEEDIIKVASYIEAEYEPMLLMLGTKKKKHEIYDSLMHMLVVHAMLLIRRRPIDFKHATLQHYTNIDRHDELLEMSKGYDLTPEMLEDCKRFHIFYVPGKNLQIVPIVFTPSMKKVCDALKDIRNQVGIKNDKLFCLSRGAWINPADSIRLLKKKVEGLKRPGDLTGNGLRHQAATFSRLKSSHPQYQDYLASTLGHTLAVHKAHYELPMGILQKVIVCPILNDIMTKNKEQMSKKKTAKAVRTISDDESDLTVKTTDKDEGSDSDGDSEGGDFYSSRPLTSDESEVIADPGYPMPGPSGTKIKKNRRKFHMRIKSQDSINESELETRVNVIKEVGNNVSTNSAESQIVNNSTEGDKEGKEKLQEVQEQNRTVKKEYSEGEVSVPGEVFDLPLPTETVTTPFDQSSTSSYSSGFSFANDKVDESRQFTPPRTKCTRTRWTVAEQDVVLGTFAPHIINKQVPTRGEIADFVKAHPSLQRTRTLEQVVMFVRNYALRSQKNVSPIVKAFLMRQKMKKAKKKNARN